MGSGKRITRSLKYHGKDKHVREILEFHPSRDALVDREGQVVTKELIETDPLCMNLDPGGRGAKIRDDQTDAKLSAKLKEIWSDPDKRKAMGEKVAEWWTDDRKAKQSSLKRKQHEDPKVIKNISVGTKEALSKPAAKRNMSEAKVKNWEDPEYRQKQIAAQNAGKVAESYSEKQRAAKLGEKNPNFGSMWIHSAEQKKSMRISSADPIPAGWEKGRKIYKVA
jgi:hypothetical protein